MRTVCAWCHKTIKDDPDFVPGDLVSHGICVPCKTQLLGEVPVTVTDEVKCPHGVPGNQFCVGCEATVGGNQGA